MMNNGSGAKKYMIWTTAITLMVFLLPALIIITVDPYFYFHKPFYMKTPTFSGTERFQNAGLINSYLADPDEKIDTILIGTSLSQNFPVTTMKNASGVPILKLTVAGGFPLEKTVIFKKAMATGNVHHVVWEVISGYSADKPDEINDRVEFPFYLYTGKFSDQWHYIFNNDVLERALGVVKGKKKGRETLDKLYTWEENESFEKFNAPTNVANLAADLRKKDYFLKDLSEAPKEGEFPNVDANLLAHIRRYPDVEFQIYFPPTSYYQYAEMGSAQFSKEMRMREYILRATSDMKNVRVYGFDLIDGIGDTMKNYRDTVHYRPSTNALIADSFVNDKHRLTVAGWPAYKKALIARVNRFSSEFLKRQP